MCGVKTDVVTAVEILDKHAYDGRQFPALVQDTARHFPIAEVSADKAYSSCTSNADAIVAGGVRRSSP
jgi:hypothetical protein